MTNASTDYYSTKYLNIVRPEKMHSMRFYTLNLSVWINWCLQEKFVPSEIEIVKREREIRMDQPFAVLMDQDVESGLWQSIFRSIADW
jgi:zinc protease